MLRRVDFLDPDAVALRARQTAEVDAMYADDPAVVHRGASEGIDPESVVATFVGYSDDGEPIGHICLRRLDGEYEVKRMYILSEHRGSGLSHALLDAAEGTAVELGARRIVLHTGNQQRAAVRFYEKRGYTPIPLYPPYEKVTYSLCFERVLSPQA